jgi:hypothetical protein
MLSAKTRSLLIAACGAALATTVWAADELDRTRPGRAEPELTPDAALLGRIAALADNTWLRLGPVKTAGNLSWCGKPAWPNTKRLAVRGPGGRDYCTKMAWAPDRKRALYCGANHRTPHFLNDVWEYDLASNTWACLCAPDPQYPIQGPYPYGPRKTYKPGEKERLLRWVRKHAVYRDGLIQTPRGGPLRPCHTWWGLVYDPRRRRLLWLNPSQGLLFTDEKTLAEGLGIDLVEASFWKKEKAKHGGTFWQFDPFARKWAGVSATQPDRCAAACLEYLPDLETLWYKGDRACHLYDRAKGTWRLLAKRGPPYGTVSAYDPRSRTVVAVDARKTWTFSFADNTWRVVQEKPPIGGRDATCFFYHDPVARRFVLYTQVAPGGLWLYDLAANQWTDARPKGDPPPRKRGHMTGYYDPARNVTVYYDGREVWVYRCKRRARAARAPAAGSAAAPH